MTSDREDSLPRRSFRIRRGVAALGLAGVVGWRLFAAGYHEAERSRDPDRLGWGDLLVADLTQRSRWTLEGDHELFMTLRRQIPEGSVTVLYTSVGEAVTATRSRMVQLHSRLLSLLYPADLTICFGTPADAAAYRARLDSRFFLANVTPDDPIPLADDFALVAEGEGFSLWRFRGAP